MLNIDIPSETTANPIKLMEIPAEPTSQQSSEDLIIQSAREA